jgi:hypothetical protein
MGFQVLVIQCPALFHVDEILAGSVAAGTLPCVSCVYANWRGIKVQLLLRRWIITGIYVRVAAGGIEIGGLYGIPGSESFCKPKGADASTELYNEIVIEINGPVGRVAFTGGLYQAPQLGR